MIHREWMREIRSTAPRIHCITNYVTAVEVANIILAAGGSPIMAREAGEVEDVVSICQGLVLNIGTLDAGQVDAMILAGKKAASLGLPIILDPVGVTASGLRRASALRILKNVPVSLIRGNASEISALLQSLKGMDKGNECGVDSRTDLDREERIFSARSLGGLTGAVVAVTGEEDIVASRRHLTAVQNGHPWMARITGGGCMLDGIMGVFCAAALRESCSEMREEALWQAAVAALCAHGICGELAAGKAMQSGGGTGMFRMYLMDYMSILDDKMLERGKKIEIS